MTKKKIEAIATRLHQLEDEHEMLTADVVVQAARDPEDILHAEFEWDDSVAAERHRMSQARQLIRRVRLEVTTLNIKIAAPHYVAVTSPRPGYMALGRIKTEADLSRATIRGEIRRCIAAVERARAVADVLDLRDQMEDVLSRLLALKEVLDKAA